MTKKDLEGSKDYGLKSEWDLFLKIIFSPIIFVLLVSIIVLIFLPDGGSSSQEYETLVTIVISIFSGVAGALILSKWSAYQESGVLATRGKSAVRGLKLLLHHLSTLEERLLCHKSILKTEDHTSEIVFDESLGWCRALQEETLNSIEEWVGIVPDADIKVLVGELSKLKSARAQLEGQIQDLKNNLDQVKDDTGKEKEALKKQLVSAEKKLNQLEQNIDAKEVKIGSIWSGSASSSVGVSGTIASIASGGTNKCEKCGLEYSNIFSACPYCSESIISKEFTL